MSALRPSRFGAVVLKELRQMSRDPTTLTLLIVIPAAMLLLFGYALTLDVEHVRLAVCDLDRTEASRDLVSRFTRGGTFDVVAEGATPQALERLLDAGEARAGLVIPPGFARDLAGGRGARVQLLLDGSDSNTARVAQGLANVIARQRGTEVLLEMLGGAGGTGGGATAPLETRSRTWFNPDLKSTHFVVPGLLGIVLLLATMMMTAMSVVRERERGTLEVLVASPIRPLELIAGKATPYVAVAFLDLFFALAVAVHVFGVPFRGDLGLLLGTSAIFVAGSLGFGLLISTIARSQQAAWSLGLLTTMLPSFLLSGFIFPIENMTPVVRELTRVVPARYYLAALRGIVLKGAGFWDIAPQLAALGVFAVAFPGLAAARFVKRVG